MRHGKYQEAERCFYAPAVGGQYGTDLGYSSRFRQLAAGGISH